MRNRKGRALITFFIAADLEAPPPDPVSSSVPQDWGVQSNGIPSAGRQLSNGIPSAVLGRQLSTNDLAPLIGNRSSRTSSVSSYGTDEDNINATTTPGWVSRIQLYPPGRIMLLTPPTEETDRTVVEWINPQ
jgi:hypothetical protein